jgi:phosphoglycolate phosphatase
MDLLIFDLDGTLIDSRLDLAHAVNATRVHLGMPPLENERVYSYVGHGAPMLIRRALGPQASEGDIQDALEYFLEYYRDHALVYTTLYPGVKQAIERISDAGKKLAILTNKPVNISRSILQGLGIADRFFRVYGGNSFDHKKPHPIGVETLMREAGVKPDQTMMVGDSAVDIETARNAGIASCGVLGGFQPESLADPKPDLVVDRIDQLAHWVLTNGAKK